MHLMELERIRIGLEKRISPLLRDATTLFWIDRATDDIVLRIEGFVWGKNLDAQEVRYPANWIEAVKERWLPKRIRRRWPVRYTIVRIEARFLYPEARRAMPPGVGRVVAAVYAPTFRTEPEEA